MVVFVTFGTSEFASIQPLHCAKAFEVLAHNRQRPQSKF